MFKLKSAAIGAAMCIAAASFTAGPAQAALISIDDSRGIFGTPGSGAVTFDETTNLEWLDLTFSTSLSFDTVVNEFGAGGTFEGWRHASNAEVTTLFANGGFSPLPVFSSPVTFAMVSLIVQLGRTGGAGEIFHNFFYSYSVDGITGTPGPIAGTHSEASLDAIRNIGFSVTGPNVVSVNRAYVGVNHTRDYDYGPHTGHWLVRSPASVPVSEPTALILFGSGIVLLGAIRRRIHGT